MKWVKRILLILSIAAVVAGAIWVMDWLGIFKVKRIVASIPIVNKLVTVDQQVYSKVYSKAGKGGKAGSTIDSGLAEVLQRENEGLKLQNDNLKKLLTQTQKAQQQATAKNAVLEQQIASQAADQSNAQNSAQTSDLTAGQTTTGSAAQPVNPQDDKYKQLAKYYAEMKPKDAVKTMNLLDDSVVLGILTKLDADQTAKILAVMEPKRAANLVDELAQ